MKKQEIDKDRGLILFRTSKGWAVAKLSKFNMLTDDNETSFLGYEIMHKMFDMALVPEKTINKVLSCITEESYKELATIDMFS